MTTFRALTAAILVGLSGLSIGTPSYAGTTYQIPATIASDCSVDVTQPILSLIALVPDNSTLSFDSGACYRVDEMLQLTNRNGLVFEGNGATFRAFTTGAPQRAHWRLIGGSNFIFRNMTIQGAHPNPGTPVDELQWQHGIDLRGVTSVEVDHVSIVNPYGDCIYVGRAWDESAPWTRGAYVHDSSCVGAGRQGIAVTAGRDVVAERISLSRIARNGFDVEPNGTGSGAENVTFRNSQVSAPLGENFFVVIGSGPVNGVTVAGNTLVGKGMYMAFLAPVGQRRSNITITSNSSDTGLSRPGAAALDFVQIDGVTVTGNTIPLSGPNMALAWASESCNVNVSGNGFPGGVVEARIAPYSSCASVTNQPPTVELTTPTDGAIFSSSLIMRADARDDNGVSKVEFWASGKLLNTDQSAPYSYTWYPNKRKAAYGQYAITAKSFDGSGLSASDSVTVTRLPGTSTTLQVRGGGAKASFRRGSRAKRAHGRVKGTKSGWAVIRLERFDRVRRDWVKVKTRKLRVRRGKFGTRLRGIKSGRWRARATFRGTRNRAPSASRYRYFLAG